MRGVYRVYRVLFPSLKKNWKLFSMAYAALIAATIMNLLKPWPLKLIFDYILLEKPMPERIKALTSLAGNEKSQLLALLCAGIVVIFFLEGLFTFIRKYFMAGAGERAVMDIRQQVFGHLQMIESGTGRSSDFIVRLTSDIDSLKVLISEHMQHWPPQEVFYVHFVHAQHNVFIPIRFAAINFSLTPPTGNLLLLRVSSPETALFLKAGIPLSKEIRATALVAPADGLSFGIAPAGT